ncbi:Bifunctional protein FolD 4, chloroplastic [Sesamum alatum]|uniref:Bifunctional protein FolD 4, chloroplastic n=1 Tax=Sesamum alatum TaxID=300844 RepID=A0AAE1XQ13_9LAMI|nr:Bifunctional protein FolD 4, chloroplastic [Sesamum alatum]
MATEASAKVMDGKSVATQIREEIATKISRMKESTEVVPGLVVILVGDRKDSATYVRNLKKARESVGINSYEVHLAEDSSEQEVLKYISGFNNDPYASASITILQLMGKRAAVIGRSNIVGMPAALLLQREDATVTVVHSRTKNPEEITREADILIAAVGQPNMVRGSWIKPGSVVIDVGINPIEDANSRRDYWLVGDVCYEEASRIGSAIPPVPGEVGPMTISMLLSNTLADAKRANNFK